MHHADRAGPGQLSLLGPEIPSVAEQVVKEADIPMLVDMAYNDPQTIGNPARPDEEELRADLPELLRGK